LTRTRRYPALATLAAAALVFAAVPARAQVTKEPEAAIFPDPKKFASGFFTEGEIGGVAFLGPAGDAVAPGFAIGTRLGYDIFRFFAVQVHGLGSTHLTKANGRPQGDQLLQTYQATVEAKLTLRFGQLSLFGEGGVGLLKLSTNILHEVSNDGVNGIEPTYRTGLQYGGGGGLDYHSLSRHFSIGLRGELYVLRDLSNSKDIVATTYLRYTF
jgi:opacity protein-like surface antigen